MGYSGRACCQAPGHTPLTFKLYATGRVLTVDGGRLTLITAELNAVTIIVGFAAIRRTLTFDKRLAFAGYGRPP